MLMSCIVRTAHNADNVATMMSVCTMSFYKGLQRRSPSPPAKAPDVHKHMHICTCEAAFLNAHTKRAHKSHIVWRYACTKNMHVFLNHLTGVARYGWHLVSQQSTCFAATHSNSSCPPWLCCQQGDQAPGEYRFKMLTTVTVKCNAMMFVVGTSTVVSNANRCYYCIQCLLFFVCTCVDGMTLSRTTASDCWKAHVQSWHRIH